MKNKLEMFKNFLMMSVLAFFVANISYGQLPPKEDDVIKKVNIKNESNYDKLFIHFKPGDKKVVDAHKSAVMDNRTQNKEFLKSSTEFHYGFARDPVEEEENLQNKDEIVWGNNGTDAASFQAYIVDKAGKGEWVDVFANFKYRPNDKEVDVILTVQ